MFIEGLPNVKFCKKCNHNESIIIEKKEVCEECKEPWNDKKRFTVTLLLDKYVTTVEAYDEEDAIEEATSEINDLDFDELEDLIYNHKVFEVKK